MTVVASAASYPEFATWKREIASLDRALSGLVDADWQVVTGFKGWRVFDHVHHLNVFDIFARQAASAPDAFRAGLPDDPLGAIGAFGGEGLPDISAPELLQRWRKGATTLAEVLAPLDRKARLPWFGPNMSVRAFVSARQMETWAHGQTVHDALGLRREMTDDIRPICELGWRTMDWAYAVNGREMPQEPLFLQLTAPSGETWTWGDEAARNRVSGPAGDFALVVAQCRNVADMALEVVGETACEWMSIAQCFAGKANPPPRPGERVPTRAKERK